MTYLVAGALCLFSLLALGLACWSGWLLLRTWREAPLSVAERVLYPTGFAAVTLALVLAVQLLLSVPIFGQDGPSYTVAGQLEDGRVVTVHYDTLPFHRLPDDTKSGLALPMAESQTPPQQPTYTPPPPPPPAPLGSSSMGWLPQPCAA